MGCGGPALFHSAHHVTTAVGTPLCWRLTRCHRVLTSQMSNGLIGWVGVGIKYSKPFVCICNHTATRIRLWRGCPAEVGNLTVSVSWPTALHCSLCPTSCSPGNVPTPTPAPLMAIPLSRLVSNCIKVYHPEPGQWTLRPGPYGQTSIGGWVVGRVVWVPVANQPVTQNTTHTKYMLKAYLRKDELMN